MPETFVDDCLFIGTTRGQYAIIDSEDEDKVLYPAGRWGRTNGWIAVKNRTLGNDLFYALRATGRRSGEKSYVSMARLVMDAPDGMEVDHINGDTLDNRKRNLRIVTREENNMNRHKRHNCSSKYKGVSLDDKSTNKTKVWKAYIGGKSTGGRVTIGRFSTEDEAALAYNKAAARLFGEFAKLNEVVAQQKESA